MSPVSISELFRTGRRGSLKPLWIDTQTKANSNSGAALGFAGSRHFVGKVLWLEKTPLKTPPKNPSILDMRLWNDLSLSLSSCQIGLQKGTLGSCKFHSIV